MKEFKNFLIDKDWNYKEKLYEPFFDNAYLINKIKNPSASIIVISSRNHPDTLKNFQILKKQRNENFELIYVNNGFDGGKKEYIKKFVDIFINLNVNKGAYLARNIGAVFSSSKILIFLDDDAIPAKDFVYQHINNFNKYDVIAVRGVVLPKTKNKFNDLAKHYYLGDKSFPIYSCIEGNSSYISKFFFEVGGWDDNIFFGGGGIDLSIRLSKIEPELRKQIYSPKPIIYHDYVVSRDHLINKKNKQKISRKRLKNKHPNWDMFIKSWDKLRNEKLIPSRL